MHISLDQQVERLMRNTQFGDTQTGQVMAQALRLRLAEARPLRVYLGVDPTSPDLHLGHVVPLQALAAFQDLGHECILVIGDFTARIGDPSDKNKARPQLTRAEIERNVDTYRLQAFKILDPTRTQLRYNSEWLEGLSLTDMIQMAGSFTVAQFLERDNFSARLAGGDAIHLHEFFYALMQGYDAFALQADVQIGGTDQTFNILAGRRLQEIRGQKPQIMLTNPILPGTDGKQKMSKSLGNAIPILSEPSDMYGLLMSIPDAAMRIYFELLANDHPEEIDRLFADMEAGKRHPRDVKMLLARTITARMSGESQAAEAEAHFITVFQQHETPPEMPQYMLRESILITDLIVALQFAPSKSAARRLIEQGGVRIDDRKVADIDMRIDPPPEKRVMRVGKRHFIELVAGSDDRAAHPGNGER